MGETASGSFEVHLTPQPPDDYADGSSLGRMSINKEFHGELEGTSKGQMLTAISEVEGSAGYVAIERVTGRLHGRLGSFVLQHSGTMSGTTQELQLTVVPDSGTGQLVGLTGRMAIVIVDGAHSYRFDYELPTRPDPG